MASVDEGQKKGRGRPVTGEALSSAERKRLYRLRRREEGKVALSVFVPGDVAERLEEFLRFKDETKDHAVERALVAFLRKR